MKPNINLLRDAGTDGSFDKWLKELNIKNDAFCLNYNNRVFYIAAKHTTDKNSQTYKLIKKILKKHKIDLLIVEGIPEKFGMNPELKKDAFHGEGAYAISLAKKDNVKYRGIEANENKLLKQLSKIIKPKDIYGYLFLRMAKFYYLTLKRNYTDLKNDFIKYEKNRLDEMFGLHDWNIDTWFKKTYKTKYHYGSFLEYAAPYSDKKAKLTQKISYTHSQLRNVHNLKKLYKELDTYKTVLYIYGMNHSYSDYPVLKDTFGEPNIIQK